MNDQTKAKICSYIGVGALLSGLLAIGSYYSYNAGARHQKEQDFMTLNLIGDAFKSTSTNENFPPTIQGRLKWQGEGIHLSADALGLEGSRRITNYTAELNEVKKIFEKRIYESITDDHIEAVRRKDQLIENSLEYSFRAFERARNTNRLSGWQ